ncbi:TPA: sensor histidine kinase [Clostridioides difficile]|nr:sensor histidine kinase [Clostridioides difficile]HBG5347090.1 sensor histidine kinase [Clostridioides difficile]
MRTALMAFIAIIFIWILYSFILYGKFSIWIVSFFENAFRMEYKAALNLYQQIFRNSMELFMLLAMVIVFFVIFRVYLNWFTKYFSEINQGIDFLIKEDVGEVALSPELLAIEKKINSIKHILEQRKFEAQMAEQRKNELIVYLAHDLKTPLTSVIGYLTLLRDENQISEELRKKYLSISLDKAERLEDLINEFFEITRFNLSNISLEYSTVNLTRMLEQLTYEFTPTLMSKNLKYTLNVTPNMMIRCDVNKMQRVFDNLLRNAVYYSFEDTTIEITAVQEDDYIKLKFINYSNTIPEEKLERIFEQFYRLDTSRNSNSGRAGLGLAIAKEIVELHNGTITAHSENNIITFKVIIPIVRNL